MTISSTNNNLSLNGAATGTNRVTTGAQTAAQTAAPTDAQTDDATPRDGTAGVFCRLAVSCDEVEDLVAQCVSDYPPARVEIARRNKMMGWDYLGAVPGGEFNLDDLSRRFGGGEYRAVVKLPNRKRQGIRFTMAAAEHVSGAPLPSGAASSAPTAGDTTQAVLAALLSKLSNPAPAATAPALDLNQLIMQQMQGQQALLQALIVKTLDKPDPTGNKISELEAMLKLAERLSRRGGGADDDAGGGGLLEIGKSLATAFFTSQATQPAPAPGAAAAAAARARNMALVSARRAGMLPAQAAQAAQTAQEQNNTQLPVGVGDATTLETPPTGTNTQTDPSENMNPLALIIRSDKRAQALHTLILAADENTSAESVADVACGVLGDDIRQFAARTDPGTFAAVFIQAFPALAAKNEFMVDIEKQIRQMLSEPDATAADAPANNKEN